MQPSDLIITDTEKIKLQDLFLEQESKQQILALLSEHRYIHELHEYGLPVNNKIILYGASGCGKTSTAKAIAAALGKPLLVLNLSTIICARIGETAHNLKMVFDKAARDHAVLFLDEFDQIGKTRDLDDNDSGEMRRLINTLIQLIDYYPDTALLIAATNHLSFIDPALSRRFQLKAGFSLPGPNVLDQYYNQLLARFPEPMQKIARRYSISFAEAKDHALTAVKSALITQLRQSENLQEINIL